MSFKLYPSSLPEQTVDIKFPSYEKHDSTLPHTDYRAPYAGGEAHVVEYEDGHTDVYVNWD